MKTLSITICAVAAGTTVSTAAINLSQTYSSFVAFGDSLTDDGKFNDTPFEPGLPGLDGRYTNGITFAENVAQDFSFSQNFAIGGATARNQNENALPPSFGTFSGQVSTFSSLASTPLGSLNLGDRPLFSVLMGTNDILQNIGSAPDFDIEPDVGVLAANAVEANIRSINALNIKFNDFVVMNLPDLSQTPLFQNEAFGAGAFAPLAALEVARFNMQLAGNIDSLRSDGINIIGFDLNSLMHTNRVTSESFGVDINTPCTFDLFNPGPEGTCVFSPGAPDNTDLSLANDFFYIDGTNPNMIAHSLLANQFRHVAVPEPASLSLLMVGFAASALRRTR